MIYSLHISYDHVCRNNGVDQLHCNMQLISVFVLTKDSIIPVLSLNLIPNFKPLAIFCGCIAGFVSDLVANLKDRSCPDVAHMKLDPIRIHSTR